MLIHAIEYLRGFNFISVLTRILMAVVLSSIIGIEREKHGRAAGLRTHILVCLGATIASMTGVYITKTLNSGDVSRIAAQVVSGIGFLGAGTILVKNKSVITGLTTAAGVWAVGTIGIALGYGFYEGAIMGAIVAAVVTGKLGSFDKDHFAKGRDINLFVEFISAKLLSQTLEEICTAGYEIISIQVCEPKTNIANAVAANITLRSLKKKDEKEIIDFCNKLQNVNYAIVAN